MNWILIENFFTFIICNINHFIVQLNFIKQYVRRKTNNRSKFFSYTRKWARNRLRIGKTNLLLFELFTFWQWKRRKHFLRILTLHGKSLKLTRDLVEKRSQSLILSLCLEPWSIHESFGNLATSSPNHKFTRK